MKRCAVILAMMGALATSGAAVAGAQTLGPGNIEPECRAAEMAGPHYYFRSGWSFPTPGLREPRGIIMAVNAAYPLVPEVCVPLYNRIVIGEAWVAAPTKEAPDREVFLDKYVSHRNLTVKDLYPDYPHLPSRAKWDETGFLYQENSDNGVAVKKVCEAIPSGVHMSLKWKTIVKSKATGKVAAEWTGILPVPLDGPDHCR